MNINQKVASNIRQAREEKNLKINYVASLLEISRNSYSLIENGTTKITVELLEKLSHILETPIPKFIDNKSEISQNYENNIIVGQCNSGTLYFQISDEELQRLVKAKAWAEK